MLVPRSPHLGVSLLWNFTYSPHTDLFMSQSQAEGPWEEGPAASAAPCKEQANDRHSLWPGKPRTLEAGSMEVGCFLQTATTSPTACLNSTRAASTACAVVVPVIPCLVCKDHCSTDLAGLFSSNAVPMTHIQTPKFPMKSPFRWAILQICEDNFCREDIEKMEVFFLTQLRRSTTGCFSAVAPMFKLPAQPLKTNIWGQTELFFVATAIL